jgi:rhodanese-related sulfurtransferase
MTVAMDDEGVPCPPACRRLLSHGCDTLARPRNPALELIEHLHAGRQLIDTRQSSFVEQDTIPSAVAIPHTEIDERLGELEAYQPIVLFCNDPQSSATPDAVRRLLVAHQS